MSEPDRHLPPTGDAGARTAMKAAAASAASFDQIGAAKTLLRSTRYGALGSLDAENAPYTSLVNVGTDVDGAPVILISRLALHTKNILRDSRVSLMLSHVGGGDPSAHPRISIKGRASLTTDENARRRFLARHPGSAGYSTFADFGFYRIEPESAHLVAGFGRIYSLQAAEFMTDLTGAEAIVAGEAGAVAHMNEDHADALELYAVKLLGQEPGAWQATGIDPDGLDLMLGDKTARLPFPKPAEGAGLSLRGVLKDLAQEARRVA
ncbi:MULTISPECIES: DUF2470 domain-containing protein [unclassified Chelatococcus]|jgi:putative heme iron utilization protein|uniref:HugZ family pyridoxamine 5'-phosphate oxidase n=1 Tax=unclassified Chelatococcus TaxID=2638111 RepID=UPI0020C0CDFD|nr:MULTISPECIES: DUF2470 domain-containing protein [unclassified Chelatococcus]MCO5078171.1 DUF2470 domain-containing protein [Chelatococcus sp.]CAH1656795.1 conserved hypothetical protein [Hyphomicrobiales bacterium]CAH1684628.1 conserved hypothetical protein [Hyphomicrobiales bacterium]